MLNWINAKESLPETDESVLVYCSYYYDCDYNHIEYVHEVAHYYHGDWIGDKASEYGSKVLYWMPIPPTPSI